MVKYTDFVKMKYDSVRHLPAKERIGAIAKLWKGQKGGALDMDIPIGIAKPQPKSGDYRKGDSELTLVARNVPANQYGYMTAPLGDDIPIGIGSRLQVAPGMSMPDSCSFLTLSFANFSFYYIYSRHPRHTLTRVR